MSGCESKLEPNSQLLSSYVCYVMNLFSPQIDMFL